MQDAVLVLNANFQPINVCSSHRAINLIVADKATLVLNGRGYIYSVSQAFPKPSIIRLDRMITRPRLRVPLSRNEVFRRDNNTCQYCGKRNATFTIDHVLPRKSGGLHRWDNVVTACISCNHHKGSQTPEQAQMRLMSFPADPPASALYYFQGHITQNEEWEEYVRGW
ncbi:MAG: HNH endonuclease [Anaerolinea sp.]|nr:HNH endonuclease [Anaerolinea sp.]